MFINGYIQFFIPKNVYLTLSITLWIKLCLLNILGFMNLSQEEFEFGLVYDFVNVFICFFLCVYVFNVYFMHQKVYLHKLRDHILLLLQSCY